MPGQSFDLIVVSHSQPPLKQPPSDIDPSLIRSPLIRNDFSPTLPLHITVELPAAKAANPLYPASHLHVSYQYEGTAEVISTTLITKEYLTPLDDPERPQTYTIEIPPEGILRAKVNDSQTPDATIRLRAWKGEKMLGVYDVGIYENLGYTGFKSQPIHLRLVEQWKATRPGFGRGIP